MNSLNWFNQAGYAISYIFAKKFWLFILSLFFIIITFIVLLSKKNAYDDWIDPFFSLLTLFIAIAITSYNYFIEWKNSLPKTLTVHLIHNGNFHLSCYYTDLTSEADIRTWGQQVLKQMAGNTFNIDLSTHFDIDGPDPIDIPLYGKPALHYTLFMFADKLDALPIKDQYIRWFILHKDKNQSDTKKIRQNLSLSQVPIEPTESEINNV